MSDDYQDNASDADIAPHGAALLVESALHSPPAPPRAEAAAQERAITAYQEWLVSPSALHPESWNPDSGTSLFSKLSRFLRRLRDR